MTDQKPQDESHLDILFKLDAQRRQEIDSIKIKMEEFLRGQIEFKHSIEMVTKGQDSLKERFEMGVSKTLTALDHKFDAFMIEWGTKKAEDSARDKSIGIIDKRSAATDDTMKKLLVWPVISMCVILITSIIVFLWRRGGP